MIGCFCLFSLGLGLDAGVVVREGDELVEPMGASGNAEMGAVDGDDEDEDRKSAVRGWIGADGLASWSIN